MWKCVDSPDHCTTHIVVKRVAQTLVAGLLILMMAACNVGPNYKRPATSTPQSFRGALAREVAEPAQAESSLGDQRWSTIFQDPVLQPS
jgi:outer membrane protein, multidrug efflux system